MTLAEPRLDGRLLRSSRTRAAILAAHRSLIEGGELAPSASRIAEAAGISPRTLFVHFADLEQLFAATAEAVLRDAVGMAVPPDPRRPLEDRLATFLAARADIYAFMTPFALASRMREPTSAVLRRHRLLVAAAGRDDVAATFASELAALPAEEYDDALAGLETCVTWVGWFHLRYELDLGEEATSRVLRRNVLALLRPSS